jgi:four helix bundle protein
MAIPKYDQSENPILKHSFAFALKVLRLSDELLEIKKYSIADQLSRSGTSIGANVFEAQSAESRKDFLHKLKIAAKEAEETKYWLLLCKEMGYLKEENVLSELEVICKILGKIISSSKTNQKNEKTESISK